MADDNASDRIVADLRRAAAGSTPGTRLPSVRELVTRHRASALTVQRALGRLATEGVLEARPGRGTFVAAARPGRAAAPGADLSWQAVALGGRGADTAALLELLTPPPAHAVALSGGYPADDLQPLALAGAALARAARRPGAWRQGPVEGRPELRAWFAETSGGALQAHDMVVTPGAQAALTTAFRALAAPGQPIVVESPTYPGALAAARAAGLHLVPVPADDDGLRPDLLDATLRSTGARLVYTQPLYANPTGSVLAPGRREDVLRLLAVHGAFAVEDDWARELTMDGDPPPPLVAGDDGGHVVHVRSLTKSVSPGLRVAAVGARGAAGARLRAARVTEDLFVSGPLQEAAVEIVSAPGWRAHLSRLRVRLGERRDVLAASLERHLPELGTVRRPGGGLHLWVRLPDGTDDVTAAAAAATHGVLVTAGRALHPAEPPAPYLRVTFAAAPVDLLDEGVRRLAAALREAFPGSFPGSRPRPLPEPAPGRRT